MKSVPLDKLPAALRSKVLAAWKKVVAQPDRLMTYEECAWYYGYTQLSLRTFVSTGLITPTHEGGKAYISHAAMRSYLRNRKRLGRPRKSQVGKQLVIQ